MPAAAMATTAALAAAPSDAYSMLSSHGSSCPKWKQEQHVLLLAAVWALQLQLAASKLAMLIWQQHLLLLLLTRLLTASPGAQHWSSISCTCYGGSSSSSTHITLQITCHTRSTASSSCTSCSQMTSSRRSWQTHGAAATSPTALAQSKQPRVECCTLHMHPQHQQQQRQQQRQTSVRQGHSAVALVCVWSLVQQWLQLQEASLLVLQLPAASRVPALELPLHGIGPCSSMRSQVELADYQQQMPAASTTLE
jgi:hypothetical protein